MDAIFGQVFRRQQLSQPLWLRALVTLGTLALLAVMARFVLSFGETIWTAFQLLPAGRQPLVGRMAALVVGIWSLSMRCGMWQQRVYLDPPLRDLATTPASPWRILRLAATLRPYSQRVVAVLFWGLFLYPWLYAGLLGSTPVWVWPWLMPLSAFAAGVFGVFTMVLVDTVALALVLAAGAASPFTAALWPARAQRAWPFLRWTAAGSLNLACGALFLLALSPGLMLEARQSSLGAAAAALVEQLDTPGSAAQRALSWFPSVAWFDVLFAAGSGPSRWAEPALWRCGIWMVGSMALTAACLGRALSVPVRAFWYGMAEGPVPADAASSPKRSFDPDGISGPVEAALLRRVGRMGRAVLRLVSANFEAGSVDAHLLRSLKALAVTAAGGWLAMLVIPMVVSQLYVLLYRTPLRQDDTEAFQTLIAVLCTIGLAAYLLWLWGVFHAIAQGQSVSGGSTQAAGPKRSFLLSQPAPTRGDNRYPLTEIYAVGCSDIVILPTLYVLLSSIAIGLCVLAGGVVFGLPVGAMLWAVAVGVPVCTELAFVAGLNTVLNYKDYRRSRLISLFQCVLVVTCGVVCVIGLIMLIAFVCVAAVERGQPWAGWLGTVNMVLVLDVAVYMLTRLVYVRRRFDAERSDVHGIS